MVRCIRMGKGVWDQISTKSSTKSSTTSVKITKTLDSATQTSIHKKEQKKNNTTHNKTKTENSKSTFWAIQVLYIYRKKWRDVSIDQSEGIWEPRSSKNQKGKCIV